MYLLSGILILTILIVKNSCHELEDKFLNTVCGSDEGFSKDIMCHFTTIQDDLPSLERGNFTFVKKSIFFIDTSCNGGLNFRQACSIEAAARAYPNRWIIVLFAGPVAVHCLHTSPMSDVLKNGNVKFFRIHLNTFLKNTPLEILPSSGAIFLSKNPVHYTSVILRFATLYKYGGVYLDLDVILKNTFENFAVSKNWIGKVDTNTFGSALMAFSRKGVGRTVTYSTMSILSNYSEHEYWLNNVSDVMKKVLQSICKTDNLDAMSTVKCKGIAVYDQNYFYPIPENSWKMFFEKYDPRSIPPETQAYHLWNALSLNETIYNDSLYSNLIYNYCPRISKLMNE